MSQSFTASALPYEEVGFVSHVQENVFPPVGGRGPVPGRRDEMFGVPCAYLGQGGRQLRHHRRVHHSRQFSRSGILVLDIVINTRRHQPDRGACAVGQNGLGKVNRSMHTDHRSRRRLKRLAWPRRRRGGQFTIPSAPAPGRGFQLMNVNPHLGAHPAEVK